jgi:hypothetical protein
LANSRLSAAFPALLAATMVPCDYSLICCFSFDRLPATNTGDSYMEIRMKNGSKRRPWTSVQIRELKTLARKKMPAARIARTLKRTEGATRQKAFAIGLSLDSRG